MKQVTIIVPCYNEETRLPLREFQEYLSVCKEQIVFVNDGSTDRTLEVLKGLQSDFPSKVEIIHLKKNVGKAEAVRQGMLACASNEFSDIIGFLDADLATPFDEIAYFVEAFNNHRFELVFGSRIPRIGAHIERFPSRYYFGRMAAAMVSMYLGITIYDSICGAKFFRARLAKQLFEEPFVSRWLFDIEIFRRLGFYGLNLGECGYELPLHTWIEKGGSKLVMRDFVKLPMEFIKIINHYLDKRNVAKVDVLYQDLADRIQPSANRGSLIHTP